MSGATGYPLVWIATLITADEISRLEEFSMPRFTWRAIDTSTGGPGPRSRHVLVHDRGARVTILFGGIIWGAPRQIRSDTWELQDGHWSQVLAQPRPTARHRGAMTFDEARGVSVLFGGQDNRGQLLNDTWIYADRRWRQRRSWWGRGPQPRCGHALAYDPETRRVVLFGGIGSGVQTLGDTWTFDGSSWREVCGPEPPARLFPAFAYDPGLRGSVLHGGTVDELSVRQFGDAWLFRGGFWERLPRSFETEGRDDHALAYHRSARALVMLEGLGFPRAVLVSSPDGWQEAPCVPLHPRHQCSPMAWNDALDGLVLHGGEMHHQGPQFEETLVLRLATGPEV